MSELDGTFASKDEQRMPLKAFLGGKDVFALVPTEFLQELIKHCGAFASSVGLRTNRKLRAVAT